MTERAQHFDRREILKTALGIGAYGAIGLSIVGRHPLRRYLGTEAPSADTHRLPEVLPPVVDYMQYGVVNIHWQNNRGREKMSGVMIDPYHVLTAGHGFRDKNNGLIPYASCIDTTSIEGLEPTGIRLETTAHRMVSFYHKNNTSIHDVTLIELAGPLMDLPSIPLAKTQLSTGDPLFFLNFQPDSQHEDRNPLSNKTNYRLPAIYGGIYIRHEQEDFMVRLGLKNYSKGIPDTRIHAGASGGAVVTQDGLIGISIISGFGGEIALVQPIVKPLLNHLFQRLQSHPDACVR